MMNRIIELFKFKEWLEEKRGLSDSTIYCYYIIIKKYLTVCKGNTLDVDNINWFLSDHTHKKRSTYFYSVLRSYVHFRTQNDVKQRIEIYDKILHPKRFNDISMERKYLKDTKLIEIMNCIDDKTFRMVCLLQILTGARAGDVISLHNEGIDKEEYEGKPALRLALKGKGGKRNVVYLFDTIAIGVLDDYIQEYYTKQHEFYEGHIFIRKKIGNRSGNEDSYFMMKKMTYLCYWRALKKALDIAGVVKKKYFATHDFRRCLSRNVWEKYRDVDLLRRVLNHENPSTTLRYLKQSGLQNIDIFKEMQS